MADDTVPEYYSDVFDFALSPYGVSVSFGVTSRRAPAGRPPQPQDLAVVRMSLEQAKILSMLLRKNLSTYERENGLEIALPHAVYNTLGVAREDWPPTELR